MILAINTGSRFIKCAAFDDRGNEVAREQFETANQDAFIVWLREREGVKKIAVRFVHGGTLPSPTLLDEDTLHAIEQLSDYAPLHNPVALEVVALLKKLFGEVPMYGVFDTHFHRHIPEHAYTYPIPTALAQKYGLRRYGFHGLAFESVLAQLKQKRGSMPENLIMLHLGGGSSVAAVKNGVCIDTSMGVTPLEGPMMITRSGSIDPEIVRILSERERISPKGVSHILNYESAFKGIVGHTDTLKIFDQAVLEHKQPEKLAYDMYVYALVKQIFAYYGVLKGVDAIVFSGGIGFQNVHIRPTILAHVGILGITVENMYAFEADETRVMYEYIAAL